MKLISVVIPVYNENENVNFIYQRLCDVHSRLFPHYDLEIIFSDNFSSDDTYSRIQHLQQTDPRVRGIRLSRNFGYQANILTGYLNARGDAVVQLDADGEDPPELIADFIRLWEQGYHVVYGVRLARQEPKFMQWQRRFFYSLLNRIADLHLPPGAGDFRLLDRAVVRTITDRMPEHNPYLRGLVSYAGFRQIGVPYQRQRRHSGPSKFKYLDYLRLAWDAITSFSRIPLILVSTLGFIMAGIAAIGIIGYFILYLSGGAEAKGFTTLILVIFLLSGVQLLSLGILGQYIARIFDEVKARPRSIIADWCGFEQPPRSA
ncbi:MAG: glycosyltransferase family 2 protein [bacterium]|nr:glycosyltransferase family 2 protein [bacterium]